MLTRCGFVALAGRPNAGKSTLLNKLVGEALAIVSPRPQTTRETVAGVLTEGDTQIIFQDTAGLLDPAYALHRAMVHAAGETLRGADLVLLLHPLADGPAPPLSELLREAGLTDVNLPEHRVITVYTKADRRTDGPTDRTIAGQTDSLTDGPPDRRTEAGPGITVSALTGEGIPELLAAIRERLPAGPFHYDAEDVGTQPLRFFVAEYIREAAFAELEQEVPYCLAVTVDEFQESPERVYIRATIGVERDSQKPIVLGKGGRTIKAIGTAARQRMEALMGRKLHLELWVAVWPGWRKDPQALARLGLPVPAPEQR